MSRRPVETERRYDLRTESLPCKLNDQEMKERGQTLAALIEEIDKVEEEKKEVAAAIKTRLDDLNKRAGETARIISTGQENREVEVYDVKDYAAGEMQVKRVDTLAIVRSRRLTPDEFQRDLPMPQHEEDDDFPNAEPDKL